MDRPGRTGQTALEYLLLAAIAVITVLAVYMLTQGMTQGTEDIVSGEVSSSSAYAQYVPMSVDAAASQITIDFAYVNPATRPVTTFMWIQTEGGVYDIIQVQNTTSNTYIITVDGTIPADLNFIKIYEARPVLTTHTEWQYGQCKSVAGFGMDQC